MAERVVGYVGLLDEVERFGFFGVPNFLYAVAHHVTHNEVWIPVKLFADGDFAVGQNVERRE